MCEFFSCIVTRDGKLWFTEDDSHEVIIERKCLRDVAHTQHFVRLEVLPPFNSCEVDQCDTPSWFDDSRTEIESRAIDLAKRVGQARAEYEKVEQPAMAEYEKVVQPAMAEYEKVVSKIEGYVAERTVRA